MIYFIKCCRCNRELAYSSYDRCLSKDEIKDINSAKDDLMPEEVDRFKEFLNLFELKCLSCIDQDLKTYHGVLIRDNELLNEDSESEEKDEVRLWRESQSR
jgi:hypothetical protein